MTPWRYTCDECGVKYDRPKKRPKCNQCRTKQRRRSNNEVLDEFFTNGCKICGEKDRVVLDAHHLVPVLGTRERRVQSSLGIWTKTKLEEELKGCVPLCANDHRRVHAGTVELPSVWDELFPPINEGAF